MRRKEYKGKCQKRVLSKCREVCRTYSAIQYAYADVLQNDDAVQSFRCNVPLQEEALKEFVSDFVCVMNNGDVMVRECVERSRLTKPMTVKLLDASRIYWMKRGVEDWGLVVDAK